MNIPVTGTQITSAVCRAIHAKYPAIPVYREPVDQDFEEPCFFVWCERTDTSPVIWPRFRETHAIEVRYYPPERDSQHGVGLDIGAELVEVLSRITIMDDGTESLPIFAADYSRRIVDDAVAISVTYRTEGYIEQGKAAKPMGDVAADIMQKE